jgi:MATE family multidrug resistance protein
LPTADPVRTSPDLNRRFYRLTLINVLSNITVPIVGLVDVAMLGHLDDIRFLAGVALGTLLFDYIYWTFGFLRMGTTGITAQAMGRGDRQEVYLTCYRSITLALIIAAATLLLQWPIREVGFALLSGEPGVLAAGRDYFNARIWGAPATLCNFVLLGWFLGREQSRHALVMTIAANLSNVVLNYVFIMRLQLASLGAGLATMVSQYLMLAVALALFVSQGERPAWRWAAVLQRGRLVPLIRLNWDILVRTLCLVSTFALFTNFGAMLGTAVLAANSILSRLLAFAAYVVDGAAFASESLAGVLLGQGDREGLRRLFRLSLLSGLGFAVLVLLAFFSAPGTVLRVLTSHDDLVALGLTYAPWLWPTLLVGSLAYMYDGLFLGMTEGRKLRNSMLLSTLVVFLPAALLAVRAGDNHLLWASLALFMLARAATLWLASRRVLGESGDAEARPT